MVVWCSLMLRLWILKQSRGGCKKKQGNVDTALARLVLSGVFIFQARATGRAMVWQKVLIAAILAADAEVCDVCEDLQVELT